MCLAVTGVQVMMRKTISSVTKLLKAKRVRTLPPMSAVKGAGSVEQGEGATVPAHSWQAGSGRGKTTIPWAAECHMLGH